MNSLQVLQMLQIPVQSRSLLLHCMQEGLDDYQPGLADASLSAVSGMMDIMMFGNAQGRQTPFVVHTVDDVLTAAALSRHTGWRGSIGISAPLATERAAILRAANIAGFDHFFADIGDAAELPAEFTNVYSACHTTFVQECAMECLTGMDTVSVGTLDELMFLVRVRDEHYANWVFQLQIVGGNYNQLATYAMGNGIVDILGWN